MMHQNNQFGKPNSCDSWNKLPVIEYRGSARSTDGSLYLQKLK